MLIVGITAAKDGFQVVQYETDTRRLRPIKKCGEELDEAFVVMAAHIAEVLNIAEPDLSEGAAHGTDGTPE